MDDGEIEKFKVKQLMKELGSVRGNGTSMISLLIPKGAQISLIANMLVTEYGTANNIKSHINKLSVQTAIKSAQERLKLYRYVPANGLVIYVGTIVNENGREKKVTYDFEPFRPLNKFLYRCDNKFAVEPLNELFEDSEVFGFIIIDGHSCLYAKISGQNKEIIHKFEVDLPKKHRKGGQSSARFGRLRIEKRHNYVRKVAEQATQLFITNDLPNIQGLIIAGSSLFKKQLADSDLFDIRLKAIILGLVDIAYGNEPGLQQAILLSSDLLRNTKYVKERTLLAKYFDNLAEDSSKVCYGLSDTLYALKAGVIETLIIWDNLSTSFKEFDTSDEIPIIDYILQNAKNYGAQIQLISDATPESSQFIQGFGGLGGFLRFKINIPESLSDDELDETDFI